MRRSGIGVAVSLVLVCMGISDAQAHVAVRHPVLHSQKPVHQARKVAYHRPIEQAKNRRAKHVVYHHEVRPAKGRREHVTYHHVARPMTSHGQVLRQVVRTGTATRSEAAEASAASFDSLAPSALRLLHLSPVPFAGVGAAPHPSPLPHYSFSQPVPTEVQPVDSAQFINASLVLAKVASNAPVTAVHAVKASIVEAKPAEAVDAETSTSGSDGTLGVALQMLASQAYYWASHPLAVLQENGDVADGRHESRELHNDIALAAQNDAAEKADSMSWLSPRGLVSAALHFIGAPYVWGGTSPRTGFDCSGFVKYILAKFDIHVPRTSYAQAASLPAIPRQDLKPGDLVFFNTMHRAFSHVGIYIGRGRFVSAQTPATGVQVASLNDPYWAARYDGARRLPHGINIS